MKITCEKGSSAKNVLQFITEYIEKKAADYPLLAEDLEIEISLKDAAGKICPDNDKPLHLGEQELNLAQETKKDPKYYLNHDPLTGLFSRSKYERDINTFQTIGYKCLTCIYIDAVGLHEVNNHLGHKVGDHMLCSIAEGLQKYFPNGLAYRIGGDEYVVLCPEHTKEEFSEILLFLKEEIRELEYEISVGIEESKDGKTLIDTINAAENAMRYDKMNFYRNHGGIRQMRSLNQKLEKLLLEKQDASHFLNVIAPKYKGVYMVNSKMDTCRYIYVPPYFQKMLDQNQGSFLCSMREYCRTLVRPEYFDRFEKFLDYDYVQEQLSAVHETGFTYQKLDGSWVELKITLNDQEASGTHEMLWIFTDEHGY